MANGLVGIDEDALGFLLVERHELVFHGFGNLKGGTILAVIDEDVCQHVAVDGVAAAQDVPAMLIVGVNVFGELTDADVVLLAPVVENLLGEFGCGLFWHIFIAYRYNFIAV